MTPIIVILFVLALCTSYVFIMMNSGKLIYVGDYKFVMFKLMIIVSIVAMGYFITWFSVCYENLPLVGPAIARSAKSLMRRTGSDGAMQNTIFRTFLEYASGVWFVLAIALLPFGHSVYKTGTQEIDKDRSYQLLTAQQAIYSGPYYFFTIIFCLHILFIFMVVANSNMPDHVRKNLNTATNNSTLFQSSSNADIGESNPFVNLSKVKNIMPTCGWFFYISDTSKQ